MMDKTQISIIRSSKTSLTPFEYDFQCLTIYKAKIPSLMLRFKKKKKKEKEYIYIYVSLLSFCVMLSCMRWDF